MHPLSTAAGPRHRQLHPHQTQRLMLSAGMELFCAQGQLLLQTSTLTSLEQGLSIHLAVGQSWRAPGDIWVQVSALGHPAGMQISQAPAPTRPAPTPSSPWFLAWLQRWLNNPPQLPM